MKGQMDRQMNESVNESVNERVPVFISFLVLLLSSGPQF